MKPTDYRERTVETGGWHIKISSYQLDSRWHCKADNVSPGAWLARTSAATREEAESKALDRARELLLRTTRRAL